MLPNLTRSQFLEEVSSVTEWAAAEVDWAAHLQSYRWGDEDWQSALRSRRERTTELARSGNFKDFSRAAAAITEWGRVPRLDEPELESIRASLPLLVALAEENEHPPDDLYASRIASVSKVYAAYQPDSWVIYDSRVARALALLVSEWEATGGTRIAALRFPQPPSRSAGVAVTGFPRVADSTPRQAGRAFIYASWWCREVARQTLSPCPDPAGWSATHIEMGLFMIGKANTGKGDAMPGVPGAVVRTGAALGGSKGAKAVAQNEAVQAAAQQQLLNLMQKREAKQRAARFAFQTGSEVAQVQYDDGVQRWTVFKERVPIAAFPSFSGDLSAALVHHEFDRLELRDPESVQEEAEQERDAKRFKLPAWMKRAGIDEAEAEEVLSGQYLLEPGEE